MIFKRFRALLILLTLVVLPWKVAAQINATVSVGGAVSGSFTISLDYVQAPATVANFIGLATGKKGWLDYGTGNLCYTPYYNGVTWHRVIAGFMSQTGSRKGDGTDGPGYMFRNEISPLLSHTTAYTVAMANSGLDTNGSQWYVTSKNLSTATAKSLDGNYTIFGHVTSGTSVCDAINAVATTGTSGPLQNNPLTPVVINSIVFSGSSLASFSLTPNALPKVLSANPVMQVSGSSYTLAYTHAPYSYYIGYSTPDLSTWTEWAYSYFSTAPAAGNADVSGAVTGNKSFFRLARVDYSLATSVPQTLAGKTLTFGSTTNPLGGKLAVNTTGTAGTWTFTTLGGSAGALTSYSYGVPSSYLAAPTPYSGSLYFETVAGYQFLFTSLSYTSGTTGNYVGETAGFTVSGTAYPNITGTFTSAP